MLLLQVTRNKNSSFSAVSTPIFASKYSLESSRRDLHNALLCTVLQTQNFSQKSPTFSFAIEYWISDFFSHFLVKLCILHFSAKFWWNFVRISRQFPENSEVCRFFNQICENKLENCRNFWNLWKLFNIIQCSLSMYFSYVPSIIFSFFNRPLFLNLLFK